MQPEVSSHKHINGSNQHLITTETTNGYHDDYDYSEVNTDLFFFEFHLKFNFIYSKSLSMKQLIFPSVLVQRKLFLTMLVATKELFVFLIDTEFEMNQLEIMLIYGHFV
jgi:hypothetical protein